MTSRLLVMTDHVMRNKTTPVHVASDRVAAFLDGRLTGADRDETVTHFAECAECRSELAELRAMLVTSRAARRRTWIGGAAALAAALAFTIVPRLARDGATRGEGPTTDIVRATGADAQISIVSPPDKGERAAVGSHIDVATHWNRCRVQRRRDGHGGRPRLE